MKKKVQKEYVEMFMENLTIKYTEKNVEKAEKKEETLKKIVNEMFLSDDYDVRRFEPMMLGITPFVKKENISLDNVSKLMLEQKYDFIASTLRVESINNLRGYVNVRYKTSTDCSWENSNIIYFDDLARIDENFNKFLNEQ